MILKTALKLIREDGLEKLTMRRLADALGVATMATYRHFKNRDELVLGIVDEVCRIRTVHRPPADATWQEQLRSQANHAFETFVQYRGLPAYIIKYGPHTKYGLQVIDSWLGILLKAGFRADESVYIFQSICMMLASAVEFSTESDESIWTYINFDKIDPIDLEELPAAKESIRYFEHSRRSIIEWHLDMLIRSLEHQLDQHRSAKKAAKP